MAEKLNIDEFLQRVDNLLATVVHRMPEVNERLASEALAMVKRRVINQGENAGGASFGQYSEHELPVFFFEGKGLSNKGDAIIKQAKEEERGISYKEWRAAHGLQVNHKDFQFSGDTWRDTGIVSQLSEEGKVITVVGAEDRITRADGLKTSKLNQYLGDKHGNYLAANEEEDRILTESYDDEILQLFYDSGLA